MTRDDGAQEDQAALRRYMIERARLAFDGTTSPHADLLLATLAGHRTASEQRGYDRAIGEVVAWLRERMKVVKGGEGGVIGTTMALCANAIEAGEHKP